MKILKQVLHSLFFFLILSIYLDVLLYNLLNTELQAVMQILLNEALIRILLSNS